MTSETQVSVGADHSTYVALLDEIKCRAYELHQKRGSVNGYHPEDGLQAELPRALYAAVELQKYANGEVGDIKSVRAGPGLLTRPKRLYRRSAGPEQATPIALYPCHRLQGADVVVINLGCLARKIWRAL